MEKQFDDTNKGALFEPFEPENILLNGTIDINGTKTKVVATKVELNNGTTMLKLYSELGTIFDNGELYSGKIGVYNKDTKKQELNLFKELSVDMIAGRKNLIRMGKVFCLLVCINLNLKNHNLKWHLITQMMRFLFSVSVLP